MRRPTFLVSVLVLALCASVGQVSPVWAQSEVAAFAVDVVAVQDATPLTARVDLHTRVPYAQLRFLSVDGGFAARYEVMADVYRADDRGRKQELVLSRIWNRQIPRQRSYAETRSDTLFDYTIQAIPRMEPGSYLIEVRLEDEATRTPFIVEEVFDVPSFEKDVALSDLLLMELVKPAMRWRPNVVNTLSTDQLEIILSYEIYTRRPRDVQLTYDVYRMNGRGRSMRKAEEPEQSLAAVRLTPLSRGRNTGTSTIPTNQLRVGMYTVVVSVVDEEEVVLASTEKTFAIQWMKLDTHLRDLDTAVAQLKYIAKKKDREALAKASTPAERRRLFEAFWEKRDPTPRTERNERLEEYYYRVAYADRSYSVGRLNGWDTDRGQVFVRFGAPDIVERYPLPVSGGGAFEVWTYETVKRRFIFTDDTGDGSYELLSPIWSERTRIR